VVFLATEEAKNPAEPVPSMSGKAKTEKVWSRERGLAATILAKGDPNKQALWARIKEKEGKI